METEVKETEIKEIKTNWKWGELRTQIYLAINIGIIDKEKGMELLEKTKKISAMIYGLIQTRKEKF